MTTKTKILNIEFTEGKMWIVPRYAKKQDNPGYNSPFPIWWQQFGLQGLGYLIGEQYPRLRLIKEKLRKENPKVDTIHGIDLENSDIRMDISSPDISNSFKVDWSERIEEQSFDVHPAQERFLMPPVNFIFCMAVLEHVFDPLTAMKWMAEHTHVGGYIYVSTPINGFKQHRRPIDCYRFLEDWFYRVAEANNMTLVDYAGANREWCQVYRKNK